MTTRTEQENRQRDTRTEQNNPSAWVIFDLDGVLIRWPQYHLPNHRDQANFFTRLQELHERDVSISVLTNRSPAAMQILAYQLGVDHGIWITESGGSAYSVADHKAWVLPRWVEIARKDVPRSRSYLEQTLGITGSAIPPFSNENAQFEPGMGFVKTVIIPPYGSSPKEYYGQKLVPVWSGYGQSSQFTIEIGKAVDINPVGLSKSVGMNALLTLNRIDPQKTPTIFIADASRDIPASALLFQNHGFVGAVGNASSDFKDVVSSHTRGILAPEETDYYKSVIHIFDQFFA